MKGIYKHSPPTAHNLSTWDVQPVMAHLSSLVPTEKLVLKSLTLKFMFLASVTAQRGQSLHIPEISHRKELSSGFEYLFVGHIDRDFKLHQGITCPPLLLGQTKFDHSHPCTLSYCLRSSRHIPLLIPSTFTFNCKYWCCRSARVPKYMWSLCAVCWLLGSPSKFNLQVSCL